MATRKPTQRLLPEAGQVVVRLYRIGHGDCFLLAFPTKDKQKPVYVLIDCGYKPGSSDPVGTSAKDICDNLRAATGGHIHVVVVTHEHQDHINGFTAKNFKDIAFGQCWLAWTEDEEDALAKKLRKRFEARIKLVAQARMRLAAGGSSRDQLRRIDDFLEFELGGDAAAFDPGAAFAAFGVAGQGANQRAMQFVRGNCEDDPVFLEPHEKPRRLPGVDGVRVFTLGPPRDEDLLHSLDPEGEEGFKKSGFALSTTSGQLAAALGAGATSAMDTPFAARYRAAWPDGLNQPFWATRYGGGTLQPPAGAAFPDEAPSDAAWRRIDSDWLYSAEELALDMNNDTNNGSLVLAFELSEGGKVLLFAADAQRGNWISWSQGTWKDGQRRVTAQDLLSRTVLYKVGHHGSHNATLDGTDMSEYANLSWMGTAPGYEREFTAMLTAVREWAAGKAGWNHPLPSIKEALLEKAGGRVFQTDTDVGKMRRRGDAEDWDAFKARTTHDPLYFDFIVEM